MGKSKAHIRYKLADGAKVPGCTTVLGLLSKPALVPWANKLGLAGIDVSKFVDDKAGIGTLAHAMVTDKLIGVETDTSDYTKNQIDLAENCAFSFWAWEKEHPIENVFFVEKPLVSEIHRFGGTQDIYCRIAGKKELIDLKTGKGIYDEAVFQCSALKVLLEENGHPVDSIRIINIPRAEDEAFLEKVVTRSEWNNGWEIFAHLLAIYKLKKMS